MSTQFDMIKKIQAHIHTQNTYTYIKVAGHVSHQAEYARCSRRQAMLALSGLLSLGCKSLDDSKGEPKLSVCCHLRVTQVSADKIGSRQPYGDTCYMATVQRHVDMASGNQDAGNKPCSATLDTEKALKTILVEQTWGRNCIS